MTQFRLQSDLLCFINHSFRPFVQKTFCWQEIWLSFKHQNLQLLTVVLGFSVCEDIVHQINQTYTHE